MDQKTIKTLLDLLNPLHGSVDRQVMAQLTDECELDAPSDREYNVNITARQERDLTQAVMLLEKQQRKEHDDEKHSEGRMGLSKQGDAKMSDQ